MEVAIDVRKLIGAVLATLLVTGVIISTDSDAAPVAVPRGWDAAPAADASV